MKIENHSTPNQSSRGGWKPDMIVWHIADGTYNGTIGWEKNPASQISSHFVLGKSGEVAQLVPLNKAAWTQGKLSNPTSSIVKSRNGINPNLYSISIECEGFWAVKQGKGMRLPQWKTDVVIRAQYPDEYSKMTAPYLYVESRYGKVPWKETMIELFAEDWEVVD